MPFPKHILHPRRDFCKLRTMKKTICRSFLHWVFLRRAFLLLAWFAAAEQVLANKFYLRDGRVITGRMTQLSRVDERAGTPDMIARPIVLIDDGLRWVYLSKAQILRPSDEPVPPPETFRTGQRIHSGDRIYHIPGDYRNSTPFDEDGRRLLEVRHPGGVEYVEQAIVELTPYYTSVTGLRANNIPLEWNKRIATNAIPREQLTAILMKLIDPQNLHDRLKLVRFYYGGDQFASADAELESMAQDWKDSPEALQQIRPISLSVRQRLYEQMLGELDFRWESGQYHFVRQFAAELEQDPRLPERLFFRVRQFLQRYEDTERQCQEIAAALKELYEALPAEQKNDKIPPIIEEIERELNFSTLRRLMAFYLFSADPQLSAAEKLAIAITGWYAGPDADNSRLAVAVSLPETEQLITDYLRSGQDFLLRQRILEQLRNLETSRPDLLAGILATMKPPFSDLPDEDPEFPGYYRFTIPNPLFTAGAPRFSRAAEIRYAVQLPPDYNPHLRYPMVVSLHGLHQTPDMQIDWWAGSWRNRWQTADDVPQQRAEDAAQDAVQEQGGVSPAVRNMRMGHATRHGYIVIAPEWNPPEARLPDYDFSIFSHAAVLCAVKDAFQRFSVNTNKVFISGHGIGGTAAWDIALAHPDLWAGAIPFNAVASKYIDAYESAVQTVPLYLVWGEMEGVGTQGIRKWSANALVLNRYLQAQANPGDITVVRYVGRGMEGFYEEILHVLDWMKFKQRNVAPTEFKVETMRPWDSLFWWVELTNLPGDAPRNMVDPMDYPARRTDVRKITVESRLNRPTNAVLVTTAPRVANVEVWLSPEMINFGERATIRVNDRNFQPPGGIIEPDIEVMLEDVRQRGDRLHPFWARLVGR